MKRLIPDLPKIKAHWDSRSNPIPYLIVPMSDGTVVRFNPEVPQPGVVKALENIRNLKDMAVGYRWNGENDESTL